MEDYNRKRGVYLLAFLVMLILNAYYCHASAVQVKGYTTLPCNDGLGECLIIEDEWDPYVRRKLASDYDVIKTLFRHRQVFTCGKPTDPDPTTTQTVAPKYFPDSCSGSDIFLGGVYGSNHHMKAAAASSSLASLHGWSLKGNDDRDWIGDKGSKFTPTEEPNHKSNTSEAQSQVSVETVPYMTARLSYWQFTYVFPVTPGPKFVRLYFYSDVYSGSFTLLRNFSASILDQKDVYKEFCINVDENQKLNLTFIPFTSTSMNYHAFINGIEIVSMPMDLYYKPQDVIKGEEFVPVYVGQPNPIYIDHSMALEMVYRLNVGGSAIQAKEDTGMFRKWSEDRDYLLSGGFVPRDPSLKPKYTKIPNYTAPDAVYQSAISMGPDSNRNRQSNLTWGLPVDTGFNYLVRLHFCEIEPEIHASGNREFYIYINYQLAEERADVLLWTDDNDTPYYKDYVVMIKNKGNDTHLLGQPTSPSQRRQQHSLPLEVFWAYWSCSL
nr:receptor-like protein kinase feronia [Quercus suber]